jgi:transcriptional regulator with XRE-family HTH domain
MINQDPPASLGARLRDLRRRRRITVRDVAEACELTESFISQVERDSVNPSIASLLRITAALGVHIADLFQQPNKPNGRVVRASQRSRLTYPGFGTTDALLSPNLNGNLRSSGPSRSRAKAPAISRTHMQETRNALL